MICVYCKSRNLRFIKQGIRNIKCLYGLKEIEYFDYKCLNPKCEKCNRTGNEFAPFASRYGWDLIEFVLDKIDEGLTYEKIAIEVKKVSGFWLANSTISDMKKKYS